MPIILNDTHTLITMHTGHSTYQMKVDELGTLLHTYYGSRIDETDMSYQIGYIDRGFSGNPYEKGKTDKTYSLDVLPQEYSCFGNGDYRISALRVQTSDGSQAVRLKVTGMDVFRGKYGLEGLPAVYAKDTEAETLRVCLEDCCIGLKIELCYGVLPELDVITRTARIINNGTSPILLQKAASMSLDWQFGDFEWLTFYGRHAMERNLQRMTVGHGSQSIGSVRGASSHHYNPFSVLCEKGTSETSGSCWGFSFLYSGEFLMEIEKDQANQTRFLCGIHPDNFAWTLETGESFQTPEVMMAYSGDGFGSMSRSFHRAIRDHICRGEWAHKRRPVLINNWEATYFNFTGEKLVSIAEESASLGIELFVMDDGWFGRRDDDNSSLGDWFPNEKKLGCTLKELGERITAAGMKFGIWFEPEGFSEDSDLYRQHPEWAVQVPGRKPDLSRNQLMLDFSREDVQDYIIKRMSDILSDAPISYVKWDMNRSICDKYSAALDAAHQGEFSHRYILGLYHVLETLTRAFPHVLFEGCCGGGGRFDAGMLYYTPQIWCSDNSDAISRLDIQYGTSFGYPVSTMGAHVSAVPNHQTGRVTPLATRGCVAMAGTFGYELDVTKLTDIEKDEIRAQIAL
ncbi:MAG: alpha-galactosidase, partial [Oscillospiraceae bacterium]|nr:alpha-galactosidase [Oscillospiraceae bacterium]